MTIEEKELVELSFNYTNGKWNLYEFAKECFNLGVQMSADRTIEYFQKTDGEAHGDNYQEEILKLKI